MSGVSRLPTKYINCSDNFQFLSNLESSFFTCLYCSRHGQNKNYSFDTYCVMCVYSACFYCSYDYAKLLSKVEL